MADLLFVSPAELAARAGLSLLVYGAPGSGKTTLLAGAPAPLIIDLDHGTRSVSDHPDLQVYQPRNWGDLRTVIAFLKRDGHAFQTIILDSLTEAYRFALTAAMKEDGNKAVPELQHHNAATLQIVAMVRAFTDLTDRGLHILMTAPEILKPDAGEDKGARPIRRPSLPPRAEEGIVAAVESVCRLVAAKDGTRTLTLHGTPLLRAKFRAPQGVAVPDTLTNPTMHDIFILAYPATEEAA